MLAALDDRIKAVAHLCCFADYDTMIELGAHDGHGHYMTIPGLAGRNHRRAKSAAPSHPVRS